MNLTLRLIGGVALLAALAALAPSVGSAVGSVEIANIEPVAITFVGEVTSAKADLMISNSGAAQEQISVALQMPADHPSITVEPNTVQLEAASARVVTLTFSAPDGVDGGSGVLIVRGLTSGSIDTHAAEVSTSLAPFASGPVGILATGLSAAIVLMTLRAATLGLFSRDRSRLRYELGHPTWNFGESWASTLTAVGAVLATVSAAGMLAEKPERLSAVEIGALAVAGALMSVLAAFLYAAFARTRVTAEKIEQVGTVAAFLAASTLTIAAVVVELLTLLLLFGDASGQGRGGSLVIGFAIVIAAAVVLVGVHAWRTTRVVIADVAKAPPQGPSAAREGSASPAPSWNLL